MFEALTAAERKQAVEACEIIKTLGWASTSSIQRRLRMGYTAAARLMDCLEEEGIIGTPDHEYQRPIYADKLDEALSTANTTAERPLPAGRNA
jgi:DNA segregation ATPase FtsK/SpoIIIE-like protein